MRSGRVLVDLMSETISAWKQLRKDLKFSQSQMGVFLDISQPRVSEIENGEPPGRELALRTWDRLRPQCKRLKIDLASLMRPFSSPPDDPRPAA